jgi:N-acetylgalactosamine kinase
VAGAQIAGAGLGGCIMILARKEAVDAVSRALVRRYYRPRKLAPAIIKCITVEGSGPAEF